MQLSPEVTFKDISRSAWIEEYIDERLGHLDRFARGITRCHVTLSREQASHRKGNRYAVMVEVRLPPQHDLAVRKHKQVRAPQTQIPALINEAFGAIEKQLKKTAELRGRERRLQKPEA
jgi:ribosomal subunit interface protein